MIQTTLSVQYTGKGYPSEGRLSDALNSSASLRPKRHSGVPERYALIIICPDTSARNGVPTINDERGTRNLLQTSSDLRFLLRPRKLRYDGT